MATDAATTPAPQDEIFHTCFLRDGTSNKSFAIVHFNPAVTSVEYQIYERNASSPIGSESINGSAVNNSADAGPSFTFVVTKQSTYFVIARITAVNGDETVTKTLHWSMDPNKRRVVSASSKKRTAAEAATTTDPAATEAAAPAPAKGKDEKAEPKPEAPKEEKAAKKSKAVPEDGEKAKKKPAAAKSAAAPITVA
jgi:hypothetical protein